MTRGACEGEKGCVNVPLYERSDTGQWLCGECVRQLLRLCEVCDVSVVFYLLYDGMTGERTVLDVRKLFIQSRFTPIPTLATWVNYQKEEDYQEEEE